MSELLQAALTYAELGYRVFPCANTENPAPLTAHGFKDASTNEEQIRQWWRRHPSACIGLATEGLLVVDIDAPPNPWLADQPDLAVQLMAAPTSLTPGGGRHHIFRRPDGKAWSCTVSRLAPHVDTRTDGGYIIVPPSRRTDGRYGWLDGCELDVAPLQLPEPPEWLGGQLDRIATTSHSSPRVAPSSAEANPIPKGQRNSTLASLAGTMRRVSMSTAEIVAALLQVNNGRCTPPLPEAEVHQIASSVSRYDPDQIATAVVEGHWHQIWEPEPVASGPEDPGPMPESMYRVPGFVSDVMDHCLATAPYPNVPLAFCGALALQALLAGRKVRDESDNRTNLYLLALAYSSVGKDWPRKLNTAILHQIGMVAALGEKFASGEGIQDALCMTPAMLFQTDEIDGLLQAINRSKDARHENVMGTLLTMYSAANTIYPMRRKAGKDPPGVIDQPCLVLYGTAIPTHYYGALSERMLTNGFMARMLVVESSRRSEGQDPGLIDPPESVVGTAQWWADFMPGSGNLEQWHPRPRIVPATDRARTLLRDGRRETEAEYRRCEVDEDAVGTTIWGRVHEQTRKLALLYAVSQCHADAEIGTDAVQWAHAFVMHQTRRMLFMAHNHVAENPFHAECLKVIEKLRAAPGQQLPHQVLLKRMKIRAKDFRDLIETLVQRCDVEPVQVRTIGRTGLAYRLTESGEGRG